MYSILKSAHSGWAYLLLLVLAIATINAIIGYFGKKEFGNKDFSLALVGLIVTHIQLLIGLALYFTPENLGRWEGFEMSNSPIRLLLIEHPLMMIIAVALLTIGYSKHKKKIVSNGKFKMLAIFYSLAFLVVLSRLPWSQWL
jgi:membrane protein YdbS with pleckstrin-like domain